MESSSIWGTLGFRKTNLPPKGTNSMKEKRALLIHSNIHCHLQNSEKSLYRERYQAASQIQWAPTKTSGIYWFPSVQACNYLENCRGESKLSFLNPCEKDRALKSFHPMFYSRPDLSETRTRRDTLEQEEQINILFNKYLMVSYLCAQQFSSHYGKMEANIRQEVQYYW